MLPRMTEGKYNGSGNGHDRDKRDNIVHMPTLAERDRLRKEKEKQEKAWRAQYKKQNSVPFFNAGKIPLFTRIMIALFVAVHLPLYLLVDPVARYEIFTSWGFVPGAFTGKTPWAWHTLLTPLTHIFIHGSWMHLLLNGTMMLVMGMFTENVFGPRRMLFFFFVCGILGAAFYFLLNPFSAAPVIGASGGISGLFAMTFLLMRERGMMGPVGRRGVWPFVLLWMAVIVGMGLLGGDIAWQAHLGGFLSGLGLFYLIKKHPRLLPF